MNILAIGEVLWDCFGSQRKLGGAAANFIYHATQLGVHATLVSAIGTDEDGRQLEHELKMFSIPCYLQSNHYPTGVVDVILNNDGIPGYTIHSPAAWDEVTQTPELCALVANADLIYFGSLFLRGANNQQLINRLLAYAKADCKVLVDVNLRQSFFNAQMLTYLMQKADFIKVSEDELKVIAGLLDLPSEMDAFYNEIRKRFAIELMVYTCGGRGSTLYWQEQKNVHLGVNIKPVDTVGAGDAFSATVAVLALQKKPLAMINHFANSLAAFVCTQQGAMPEVPYVMAENCRGEQ
ncbi:PfkB family carbohydrate kinase [Sodalis sp. RH22]|uniref:PfkB family carbohydrate kinase n=1 Tax=unclassified Sodalis (in: enterobacteria) TaxID=2636512 RepID=UPI0039B63613